MDPLFLDGDMVGGLVLLAVFVLVNTLRGS